MDARNMNNLSENEIYGLLHQESSEEEINASESDSEEEVVVQSDHDSSSELDVSSNESSYSDSENTDVFTGKDKFTEWEKTPVVSKFVKTSKRNLILPGPIGSAPGVPDILSAFKLIISENMLDEIVMHTNAYIECIQLNYSKERDAKLVSKSELFAFVGLLYLAGVKKCSKTNFKELWANDGTGIDIFRSCMSYNRFLFIMRCIRFDNKETREQRKKIDKLAALRSILNQFSQNCKECFCISEFMTVDEMLIPFRGRCRFVQYMPNKLAKYGIKVFALCDAKTFYTSNIEVYCGPYQQSNSPTDIVHRLLDHAKGKNRNMTCDNWYSSISLARSLKQDKVTMIGTLRKNRPEIPAEFHPNKRREVGSSIFGFQKGMTLVSYVPSKGKSVVLLSTMHDNEMINSETGKPEIIHDYNATKGGVATVDQLCSNYSVSRKTNRWPLCVFFQLLNIAGINAQILYQATHSQQKRRDFIKKLALDLMLNYIEHRTEIPSLPTSVTSLLKISRNEEGEDAEQPPIKKRNRCFICGRAKNRTTTIICISCKKFACKEHVERIPKCLTCVQKSQENL